MKLVPSEKVSIVHGTDTTSLKELKTILVDVGLVPIILHEQPSRGMTLIEKLEEYSNDVGFAFVILTPDDVGLGKIDVVQLLSKVIGKKDITMEEVKALSERVKENQAQELILDFMGLFKDRARQNVVLEFGYFIGKLGRDRVCCLYKGPIELPSDMHGICYVHFENSINEVKETILKELKASGYELN